MKNITTATAITSLGFPAPAGLSTSANSSQLQATLPSGSPTFSNPLLFNNIFWDNRAGTRGLGVVTGLGATGDPTPINYWDLGVADGTGTLAPTNSVLQSTTGTIPDGSNSSADPAVVTPYDVSVTFAAWRNNPAFVDAIMIVNDLPPNLLGDYHLATGSPAISLGAASKSGVNAPAFDIDNAARPAGAGFDSGADEYDPVAQWLAFPSTSILDNFNRGNSTNLGINWMTPTTGYRTINNQLQIRSGSGLIAWNTSFGANQEAYFTFTDVSTLATQQALILKYSGNSEIIVLYDRANSQVRIVTVDPSNGTVTQATFTGVSFTNGDQFGARTQQDGLVVAYKNGTIIGFQNVTTGSNPWPTALAQGGGMIGVQFAGTTNTGAGNARIDDFSGGTMP
jgi:hypothetical protein